MIWRLSSVLSLGLVAAVAATAGFAEGSANLPAVSEQELAEVAGGAACGWYGPGDYYGCYSPTKDDTSSCGPIYYLGEGSYYGELVGVDCYECGEYCGSCQGLLPCGYYL